MDIVDFHSHVLPGADHGSSSLDTSLLQMKNATEFGVKRIIATPHFYPHRHLLENFINRRQKAYNELKPCLTEELPEIRLGAEVLVCEGIARLPGIEQLCITGTNTILLELPFTKLEMRHYKMISEVTKLGFDAVLAHADRYQPKFIDSLLELDLSLQINASALSGLFIPKSISSWLNAGRVVALGSDVHGESNTAYAKFRKSINKIKNNAIYIKEKSDIIWNNTKE